MTKDTLHTIIEKASKPSDLVGLDALINELRRRHAFCLNSIILYGSCLRSANLFDGLADLYLIVDNYQRFYRQNAQAITNWLLPPNVFYIELPYKDGTIRAKYAILSHRDFTNGCSRRWFHSYIWGRFTQPVMLAYCRDEEVRTQTINNLAQAICTFIERVLPSLPNSGSIQNLWVKGLQLSYKAELRAETGNRASELVKDRLDYYTAITDAAASRVLYPLELTGKKNDGAYRCNVSRPQRILGDIGWRTRIFQGKLLSVMRLLKALFTFDGGLDYIAWKLERHSGEKIEIPDRVRRHPMIFIWSLFWRLHRRGIFR